MALLPRTYPGLVNLQHNTCPVCRKELPVDEELQREQQRARHARFQQRAQRPPAPLQSLFGALNPFHLLGRNRTNANPAPTVADGNNINDNAAVPVDQPASQPSTATLPAEASGRLGSVLENLRELEVCSAPAWRETLPQMACLCL